VAVDLLRSKIKQIYFVNRNSGSDKTVIVAENLNQNEIEINLKSIICYVK